MKGWFSSKWQEWFGNVPGNRVKPRTFAGGQNNGFHELGYLERCAMDGATKMRNTTGWFVALAIFVWGCGGDVRARIAVPTNSEQPSGDAAFETYEQAAAEMEEKGAKYIGRTAWSPDQRDQIVI